MKNNIIENNKKHNKENNIINNKYYINLDINNSLDNQFNKDDTTNKSIDNLVEFIDILKNEGIMNKKKGIDLNFNCNTNNSKDIIEVTKVKSDLDITYKNNLHPYFEKIKYINNKSIDICNYDYNYNMSEYNINPINLFNSVVNKQKILIFSPHQDDEILGASKLISLCNEHKEFIEYKIIYMTSGCGGGNSEIRKSEAVNGVNLLCNNTNQRDKLVFENFPFYLNSKREVTDKDYELIKDILNKENPDNIFVCADVFDPNKSHLNCFNIIMNVYDLYFKSLNKYNVYFYYSTWYWPKKHEINCYLEYDIDHYIIKIKAMLEHKSQIENDFMGDDFRPFYERVTRRDKSIAKDLGLKYCEVFYKINSN